MNIDMKDTRVRVIAGISGVWLLAMAIILWPSCTASKQGPLAPTPEQTIEALRFTIEDMTSAVDGLTAMNAALEKENLALREENLALKAMLTHHMEARMKDGKSSAPIP